MPISKINNAALGTIDQINTGVTGYSLGAGNASAMKNRLINGAMVIDQRNAGASVTPAATSVYTLDRWVAVTAQASKISIQQNAGSVTPPAGFSNYLGVTSLSAYSVLTGDYFAIAQYVEGFNTADLAWGTANAKTVTLSFQVYSSLTGTFGGSLRNSAANRSYPFTYSIPVANTWTTISVTIAGDTTGTWVGATNGTGLGIFFSLGAGATVSGTSGTWASANYLSATSATSIVGTSGATFYITGVQLEVGSSATGFEYRQYTNELQLCQRYYQAYNNAGTYGYLGVIAWVRTSSTFVASQLLPVTMRTTPTGTTTGTWYAGDAAGAVNYQIGTTSTTVSGATPSSFSINWSGAAGGTFNAGGACAPNSGLSGTGAYFLSAEL